MIHAGRSASLSRVVSTEDTATAVGSGSVEVLATPRLLAWMERATCEVVEEMLDASETTVGHRIELEHRRPSPVGMRVDLLATLEEVDGRRLLFEVVASNEDGQECGRARITRVVVARSLFAAPSPG